jgi:hypothetical protein
VAQLENYKAGESVFESFGEQKGGRQGYHPSPVTQILAGQKISKLM